MKKYVGPDPKAPRPNTSKNIYNVLESCYRDNGKQVMTGGFYKRLKAQYPHLAKYSNSQINRYIRAFNKQITELTLEYRDGVVLPVKCGLLMICTFGKRTDALDRRASKETGRLLYHTNQHSDGMGGGIYYTAQNKATYNTKSTSMYKNSHYWYFEGDRGYMQLVSKAYRTDWKRFRVLTKNRKYRELDDKKYVYKNSRINNEFDF